MTFDWTYISAIISSTFRMCSPILLCSLAAAICSKAAVFNIAMEGCMMISAFFSIVVNYYTSGNVLLSILAGILSSMLVSAILAFFIIKLKSSPVVDIPGAYHGKQYVFRLVYLIQITMLIR